MLSPERSSAAVFLVNRCPRSTATSIEPRFKYGAEADPSRGK